MKTNNSKTTAQFAYEGLDRVIHERARLSVLTSLLAHPKGLSFVELKQLCALTDGNLARHLQVLEEDKMVKLAKEAETDAGRSATIVRITPSGRKRYLEYLTILEQVVRDAAAVSSEANENQMQRKLSPLNA